MFLPHILMKPKRPNFTLERFDFPKVVGKVHAAIESGIPDLTKWKSDTLLHRLGSAKPVKLARKSLDLFPSHQQKKIVWAISREFQDLDSGFWISRGASNLQYGLSYFQNQSRILNYFEKLITVNITCRLKFCGTWGIFLLNNLAWYFLPCGPVSKYNLFFTIYDSLFLPLCNFLSRKGVITGWYQSEILSRTSLHKAGNSKFLEPTSYTYRY